MLAVLPPLLTLLKFWASGFDVVVDAAQQAHSFADIVQTSWHLAKTLCAFYGDREIGKFEQIVRTEDCHDLEARSLCVRKRLRQWKPGDVELLGVKW